MTRSTVVLAAHGTRDLAGVAVVRRLAQGLRARLPGSGVRLGFVDVLGPSVREVLAGAPGPVTVVPAFLSSGYHVRVDVPREIAVVGRGDVELTAALGPHPLLVRALWDRLRAAGWRAGDAVVLAATGSSDPRAVADVHAAADQLAPLVGRRVRVGFVATGRPRVGDVVAGLRAVGETRIAVTSWLLAPGLFHRRLAGAGADVLAAPLGTHPGVVDRLIQLAGCAAAAGRQQPAPAAIETSFSACCASNICARRVTGEARPRVGPRPASWRSALGTAGSGIDENGLGRVSLG